MRINVTKYVRTVVEKVLHERDWQKESERVLKHPENKSTIVDNGGNDPEAPFDEDTPKGRANSSPPAG